MKILAISLSTSEEKVGGAYIASELHTTHIKKLGVNIELWRMWSCDSEQIKNGLKIRSFKSKSIFKFLTRLLPKKLISIFLYFLYFFQRSITLEYESTCKGIWNICFDGSIIIFLIIDNKVVIIIL